MKFGKTLASHQIPEWTTHYMSYKHLKKIIKTFDAYINYNLYQTAELPELVTLTLSQFFFDLDRDIEKVAAFYNTKLAEYARRLDRIIRVLGYSSAGITHQVDTTDELDEIVAILLELRSVYRNLKWFGDLNHKGFIKILKKLDKKLAYITTLTHDQLRRDGVALSLALPTNNKENYLATRVEALPFANGLDLAQGLDTINNILSQLGGQQFGVAPGNGLALAADLNTLRIGHNRRYSFDKDSLEALYDAMSSNNLQQFLEQLRCVPPAQLLTKLQLQLLNKATLLVALDVIDVLFDYMVSHSAPGAVPLSDTDDISGRNFFHQHCVSLGKKQLSKETQNQMTPGESTDLSRLYGNKSGPDGIQLAPVSTEGLVHVLRKMDAHPAWQPMLMAQDNYHRTPLHYAAQYGTKDVCRVLLDYLLRWGLVHSLLPLDNVRVWGDREGLLPLHLAIIGKHPKTCENLVSFSPAPLACPNLLLLATRLGCDAIVRGFVSSKVVPVNYTDLENQNETALYIAAKTNAVGLVRFLLANGADPELGELVFGWTPIFAAAAEGLMEVVVELKAANALYDLVDDSGWIPMEHACLRGHLAVADVLTPTDPSLLLFNIDDPSQNTLRAPNALSRSALACASPFLGAASEEMLVSTSSIDKIPELNRLAVSEVYRQFKLLDNGLLLLINVVLDRNGDALSMSARNGSRSRSPVNRRKMKPIKSFGHRFLNPDEQLVLITLGTTDTRDLLPAVELNKISLLQSFFTELDTALSLVVTCHNKATKTIVEAPISVDLPLDDLHGTATDPLMFKLRNNTQVADIYVTFDIVPTYQYPNANSAKILGRGVALLESVYSKVGTNLRSLNNDVSVPIIEHSSMDIMGRVKFEFLCVKPFSHPSMSITSSDTYWKQLVSTRVIGHRGLGKNFNNRKSLQLGENTVESFIAAASLGASYVEFDVQLTKDDVPVIYHDFLVAESGGDIPMHMLTSEQFLGLNEHEKKPKFKSNDNVLKKFALDDELLGKYNRPRLMSLYPSAPNMASSVEEEEIEREFRDQMSRRMKLTKTWKEKGFKGNSRGSSIASNFVTLKELFKRLPKNIGFNMELKYPMLDEAQKESMGEFAFDMNFYVDTILKVVYDENKSGRDILFSLFHPDICVLLSMKQPTIPILYLTEAGTQPMADIRALSLQNAIRFAKKWNLLGIVSAAETLVKTPRLTQVVKSSGLVCVTYGVSNNDPEACKIQLKAGVDAVIADLVLAVRESMRSEDGKEEAAE